MTRALCVVMALTLTLAQVAQAETSPSNAAVPADRGAVVVAVDGSVVAAPGGPVKRFTRLHRTATLDLASGASLTLVVDKRHVTLTGPRSGTLAELVQVHEGAGDGKAGSTLAAAVGALSDWWSKSGNSNEPAAVRGAEVVAEAPWLVPAPGMLCRPCDGSALPFRFDGSLAAGSSLRIKEGGRMVATLPQDATTTRWARPLFSNRDFQLVVVTGNGSRDEIARWSLMRGGARETLCADLRAAREMAGNDSEGRAFMAASVLAQHGCLPQAEMEMVAMEDEARRVGRAVPAADMPWRQVIVRAVVVACQEGEGLAESCKTSGGRLNDAAFKPLAAHALLRTGDLVRLRVTSSRAASLLIVSASADGAWKKVFGDEVDGAGTSDRRPIDLSVSVPPGRERLVVVVSTTGFPDGVPSSADIDRLLAAQISRSPQPGEHLAAGFGAAAMRIEFDHE